MLMLADTSNPSQSLLDLRLNKFSKKNKGKEKRRPPHNVVSANRKRTILVVVLVVVLHYTNGHEIEYLRRKKKVLNKTKHTMCEG